MNSLKSQEAGGSCRTAATTTDRELLVLDRPGPDPKGAAEEGLGGPDTNSSGGDQGSLLRQPSQG